MIAIIRIDQAKKDDRWTATAQVQLKNSDRTGIFHYIKIEETKMLEVSVENEQEAAQYFLKELSDAGIDPRETVEYTIKGDRENSGEVFELIAKLELKYRYRDYDPNLEVARLR